MSTITSEILSLPPKQQVRTVLDHLPNDCTIEDIQYGLFVLERIRKGIEAADRGEVISHDEVKQRMQKWLAK